MDHPLFPEVPHGIWGKDTPSKLYGFGASTPHFKNASTGPDDAKIVSLASVNVKVGTMVTPFRGDKEEPTVGL
jgi:hypothetical protein